MTDLASQRRHIPRWDIPVPQRMQWLPRDVRGYLVPRFVSWLKDGKLCEHGTEGATPEFRAIDTGFYAYALKNGRCWLCGGKLGANHVFTIGPMCSVNRITSEPGSHIDCAHYAVKVCPFMLEPRMRRNDKEPVEFSGLVTDPAGLHHDRNPGVMLLWTAGPAQPFKTKGGGFLLKLEEPRSVEWWTKGRLATREEAKAALDAGVEVLAKIAKADNAMGELERMAKTAEALLPL